MSNRLRFGEYAKVYIERIHSDEDVVRVRAELLEKISKIGEVLLEIQDVSQIPAEDIREGLTLSKWRHQKKEERKMIEFTLSSIKQLFANKRLEIENRDDLVEEFCISPRSERRKVENANVTPFIPPQNLREAQTRFVVLENEVDSIKIQLETARRDKTNIIGPGKKYVDNAAYLSWGNQAIFVLHMKQAESLLVAKWIREHGEGISLTSNQEGKSNPDVMLRVLFQILLRLTPRKMLSGEERIFVDDVDAYLQACAQG